MDDIVHVYGHYGAEAGVLGWLLENSPSYITNNFCRKLEKLNNPHNDPWDNHSTDFDNTHWQYKWIEAQEKGDFDTLNNIMTPGVWGISYGTFPQDIWYTTATKILVAPTDRVFEYYWKCYMERNILDVKNAFDMHINDHHQNNATYKECMYNTFGAYLKQNSVPFWKLQSAFHWGWKAIASNDDLQIAKDTAKNLIHNTGYNPDITVDIFELDLSALCSKLKIKHSKIMEREYAMFLDYCNRILKI